MDKFIKSTECSNGLVGVFEDDGETGYLYSYSPSDRKVYWDLIIYQREPEVLDPADSEVKLVFDSNLKTLGVYVWGKLRGYITLPNVKRERLQFSSSEDAGISGFSLPEKYSEIKDANETSKAKLDKNLFISDRENYWKDLAKRLEA